MAAAEQPELVFVVDVSSLTGTGFTGTSNYEGGRVDIEFDEGAEGVYLTSEMAGRLKVRRGSSVTVLIEDAVDQAVETKVGGVGRVLRISNPKVYYAVGREGGAVIRLRKS